MRITVKEASKRLGVSEQFIRIGLQQNRLPIGTAVKMSSVWTYYITAEQVENYIKKCRLLAQPTQPQHVEKGRYEYSIK